MIILAIDPGYERIGIAILERKQNQKDSVVYSLCFKTSQKIAFHERLSAIGKKTEEVIQKYSPDVLAIEKLYLTNNQKTVMGVAEARGVILYICSSRNLDVFEYTPPQIKVAVTGYGKASKSDVLRMVPKLISIEKKIVSDDEMDAVAIGITCLACEKFKA